MSIIAYFSSFFLYFVCKNNIMLELDRSICCIFGLTHMLHRQMKKKKEKRKHTIVTHIVVCFIYLYKIRRKNEIEKRTEKKLLYR